MIAAECAAELWRMQIAMLPIRREEPADETSTKHRRNACTERGERQKAAAYRRILAVMRPGTVYTTRELMEMVGSRSMCGIRKRLDDMATTGVVEKISVAGCAGKHSFHWRMHIGCAHCLHPLYAGRKCKNCGRTA